MSPPLLPLFADVSMITLIFEQILQAAFVTDEGFERKPVCPHRNRIDLPTAAKKYNIYVELNILHLPTSKSMANEHVQYT